MCFAGPGQPKNSCEKNMLEVFAPSSGAQITPSVDDSQRRGRGKPMAAHERIDAIERFHLDEVEAQRRLVQRALQGRDDLVEWRTAALPTINQSVQRVSVDFGALGSPFLFSSIAVQTEGSTCFRVKTKEGLRLLPRLQFDLADGQVTAIANVPGAGLPTSFPVRDLTAQWVEEVAERVLIAMLDGA